MDEIFTELDRTDRVVESAALPAGAAHAVRLRRSCHAPIADVWDACTTPDRLARWFLPVSGDLQQGGNFQLEGHAGGTITTCDPPHRLEVTWESADQSPGIVSLELTPVDDGNTELVLTHTVADDEWWGRFGPGAVGVGWDPPMIMLSVLLDGGQVPTGEQFMNDPDTPELLRRSAGYWGAAHAASGADTEIADRAAARTREAYALG